MTKRLETTGWAGQRIEVYPVGVLRTLQTVLAAIRYRQFRQAKAWARQEARHVVGQARRGNWRAVRNSFNGYLAEDEDSPYCGHGWTHARALRSLERRRQAWMEGGYRR